MISRKLGGAAVFGALAVAITGPASATVYPTLTEGAGFYTIKNLSQFYVSLFEVSNPKATKPGLDSTTQPAWQAGYCVGGCLGGKAFFFDAESFADEIGPGQSSSKFFFATPRAGGAYRIFLSNANDSDAGYIDGAIAAPEPASWALMLVGVGGIGAIVRRRPRLTAAV